MITSGHVDASYLLKALQGYQSKGISVYAISIQVRPPGSSAHTDTKLTYLTER